MYEYTPEDWDVRKFGDFTKMINKKFSEEVTAPVLSMTKYSGFVKSTEYFNKQVFSNDISNYKRVKQGDFAYATIHLDEGSIGLLKNFQNGYISPMYTVFKTDSTVDDDYLFLLMKTKSYLQKYAAIGEGTVDRRKSVTFSNLSKLKMSLPPLLEQQKIATIISNIDNFIINTQKIIKQTKSLKTGLMQELLTRGINHKKFKKVKGLFGEEIEIPETWSISKLGNLSTMIVPMRDKPKQFDGTIPWLRIEDLDGKYVSDSKTNQKVTSSTIDKMNLKINPIGTVLCSCSATIGECAVTTQKLITNQRFIGIYTNEKLYNEYLYYFLRTQKDTLIKIGTGGVHLYISRDSFEKFLIILPPLKEQQKIASILSNVDSQIQLQIQYKEKLERLKKSLIQKLLTGHVRVKV